MITIRYSCTAPSPIVQEFPEARDWRDAPDSAQPAVFSAGAALKVRTRTLCGLFPRNSKVSIFKPVAYSSPQTKCEFVRPADIEVHELSP